MKNRSDTIASKLLIVFISCLLAAVVSSAGTRSENEIREAGRVLYNRYGCYSCHGYDAQGGGHGPSLILRPLPKEAFLNIVRRPYGVMPAYSPEYLDEAQLERIYEYVRAIPGPQDPDEIPALR